MGNVDSASGIRTTVIPGGLVLISERLPYIRSVALGISFPVGGRDDPSPRAGIAHMIEHMVFKGTADKDAVAINIKAEHHGAELNAFTDKESTCFYGRFPGDQFEPVTGLLTEIVSEPAFRDEELAKEKAVVADEIRTSAEDPDSQAANLMYQALYAGHPMAVPVAGTIDTIESMTSLELQTRYREFYGPACGIAVAVGDVRHDLVVERLAPLLAAHTGCGRTARTPVPVRGADVRFETRKELTQVYVCMARPAFPYGDQRRYALSVMNTALGGGVSSRLFQRLREQEALVYSVASFTELCADSGILGIYFATDHRKLERCVEVLEEEMERLRREHFSTEEFDRARNMTKSLVLLAMESPTSRMIRLARTYQLLGSTVTVDETVDAFNRLVPEDVDRLIDESLGNGFGHAGVVGPLDGDALGQALHT